MTVFAPNDALCDLYYVNLNGGQVFEQIEALRVAMDGATMGEGSGDGTVRLYIRICRYCLSCLFIFLIIRSHATASSTGGGGRAVSGDITQRFDKLYNQFQDLVRILVGYMMLNCIYMHSILVLLPLTHMYRWRTARASCTDQRWRQLCSP